MRETYQCRECGHRIDIALRRCPLCGRSNPKVKPDVAPYPPYGPAVRRRRRRSLLRLANFVFPVSALLLVVVNLLAPGHGWWSLTVVPLVLYLWCVVGNGVLSDAPLPVRIVVQELALVSILVFVDFSTGWHQWSVNFAVPITFLVACVATGVAIAIGPRRLEVASLVGPALTAALGGITCAVLYLVGISSILWPSLSAGLAAVVLILGMAVFRRRLLDQYLKPVLHF